MSFRAGSAFPNVHLQTCSLPALCARPTHLAGKQLGRKRLSDAKTIEWLESTLWPCRWDWQSSCHMPYTKFTFVGAHLPQLIKVEVCEPCLPLAARSFRLAVPREPGKYCTQHGCNLLRHVQHISIYSILKWAVFKTLLSRLLSPVAESRQLRTFNWSLSGVVATAGHARTCASRGPLWMPRHLVALT